MLEMLNVARMASHGLRHAGSALALAGVLLLAACGGSEAPGTSSGSGGGGTTPAALSLELKLVDSGGASVIQLAAGQSVQAQATLKRGNTPVANEIVTFSVEAGALATLSPAGGTVLTDSAGVARIGLVASTTQAGATRLSASATAGSDSASATTNFSVSSATSGGALALDLKLLDSNGASVIQLASGQSAQAQATLTRGGAPVANEIVTFSVEAAGLVTLSPVAGAVLTDANGVARVGVTASTSEAGASRLSASATAGSDSASAQTNFSVSLASAGGLKIASFTVSAPAGGLSAYGTASLAVSVTTSAGAPPPQPVTVSFSSTCPQGKATITSSATTLPNGSAQATFTDAGCASTAAVDVTLTATIATESKAQVLRVNSSTAGSLRFVSADPSTRSITLKGQGGVGRQEFATLTFRLVDVAGNGVPNADVCFDATTYVGGLNLDGFNVGALPPSPGSAALCGTDNTLKYVKRTLSDGTVVVQVNSGTTPTPLRVRARTLYPASSSTRLETVSDSLSISTGLPLQSTFDVSISSSNIEGRDISGATASLTARLADYFGNPVPDGTVVNFISSGGSVCTADRGSCSTVNGACNCTMTSQEFRPSDGRVVVLAYAVGLEDYIDANNNNQYDAGETFTDMPDAYVDANKDGSVSAGEATLRYQNPNVYSPSGDGKRDTAHLRRGVPGIVGPMVIFSGSNSPTVIIPSAYNENGAIRIPASSCSPSAVIPYRLTVFLEDGFGNPAPASSSIAPGNGAPIVAAGVDPPTVPNLVIGGPVKARDYPDVPKTTTSLSNIQLLGSWHQVTLTPTAAEGGAGCITGQVGVGIRVTTPRGISVDARVLFEGEPRSTARFAVPVVVE